MIYIKCDKWELNHLKKDAPTQTAKEINLKAKKQYIKRVTFKVVIHELFIHTHAELKVKSDQVDIFSS